jgi:hypothetical protein
MFADAKSTGEIVVDGHDGAAVNPVHEFRRMGSSPSNLWIGGGDARQSHPSALDLLYIIALWIAYNILDLLTTHVGIVIGLTESNPVPAAVMQLTSYAFFPAYKLGVAFLWLVAVILLARRWPRVWLALRLGNVLVCGAVWWNVLLIGVSI